jgi:hypothetical protein
MRLIIAEAIYAFSFDQVMIRLSRLRIKRRLAAGKRRDNVPCRPRFAV